MAEVTKRPRVVVVQFPGVNCEYETARVLRSVGLDASITRWNAPEQAFAGAAAFVVPGGFSYEDRVRAGAVAAREPVMEILARAAGNGVPILGICNGAQVLVEAGLVPGGEGETLRLALAPNRMNDRQGYYTRWVHLVVTDAPCVFTRALAPGDVVPMPMAHGEGRFTTADANMSEGLTSHRVVPFLYGTARGAAAEGFPEDPNGSLGHAAAVVSEDGLVMALMPHPERAAWLWQVPSWLPGAWGGRRRDWARRSTEPGAAAMVAEGPGRAIFSSLAGHLGVGVG